MTMAAYMTNDEYATYVRNLYTGQLAVYRTSVYLQLRLMFRLLIP